VAVEAGQRARAIVWAQWRSIWNYFPRSNKAGLAFTWLLGLGWYGMFVFLAISAGLLLASPPQRGTVAKILPGGLLLCFLYWQLVPLLMVSTGSSLDIKKLLVYPIPTRELFGLEVLLRVSTGIETLLLLFGAAAGLLFNPAVPWWAALSLLVFAIFNLFLSAGVRDLLARLLARKRIREVMVFVFVIIAALPQITMLAGRHGRFRSVFAQSTAPLWPWTATAELAQGRARVSGIAVLLAWTVAAYLFGRWQFEKGLRFDAAEAGAAGPSRPGRGGWLEGFYLLPGRIFADPLGALIEKELRFLTRSPRFRLVFLMGFSFGLLIWAPMGFGPGRSPDSLMARNYLTVSLYAALLLSDLLFWNAFGFDRGAAQIYFLVPVRMAVVLLGKNLTALLWILLEVTAIIAVCALLRLPMSAPRLAEAYAVTLVMTLFMLAIGNLSSIYNPRATDPAKSFRSNSAGRTQALMMLFFPVAVLPVALAFLARYAFESDWAFYGVLALVGVLGGLTYWLSLESAVKAAGERQEVFLTALAQGQNPIES
jgi:ABC-2 type transport system permease protein